MQVIIRGFPDDEPVASPSAALMIKVPEDTATKLRAHATDTTIGDVV